ncbi:endonuclease V [Leptolyngbya sp. 'hensonii']|uniref:deoxyribonuclease V n=1 Tax=Leptolyngbya sp. 'hensonii' TaxID=1922337 RepID=UPI000950099A|nr:deoxyribonuclease V [Leptolyngbya sp. 'hensonii']OLP18761.1 endonuclease V [Leptolyngbya sp. 'hensonii']
MKIPPLHDWPETAEAAIELQQTLRDRVITDDRYGPIHTVAGVDAAFEAEGTMTRAAVVVLSFPDLQVQEQAIARRPTRFPYIPGFLSFREVPAILDALAQLSITPDLLLCDGQGIAHPRRFGIACHLGLLTDLPAIGVAKSRLVGTHGAVPDERGGWVPLEYRQEVVGAVLRSRVGTKPLYISPGHRISLPGAIEQVMACTTRYRLPETTRLSDRLSKSRAV